MASNLQNPGGSIYYVPDQTDPTLHHEFRSIPDRMEVIGSMSKIRLILLGLSAVLAVSAVAAVSAAATVMPAYTSTNGSLIAGLLKILGTHLGNAVLAATLAGVSFEIVCAQEHISGWIENSTVTGMGLSFGLAHYLKCTIPKPAECKVHNELIHIPTHDLLLLTASGFSDEFRPEGTVFAEVTIESCSVGALNGTFTVTGFAVGVVNNNASEAEFTNTSGSSLKFGGNAAKYTDVIKIEMEGGGGLMVENGS